MEEHRINDLLVRVNQQRDLLNKKEGVLLHLEEQLKTAQEREKTKKEETERSQKALSFVESAITKTRMTALSDVETIINEALFSVYGEKAPSFHCELGVKRDRSSIVPFFVYRLKSGEEFQRSAEGFGCGVSDVASLLLRIILLKTSGYEPVVICDEPFRFLGALQIPAASALLKEIARRLNVQIIVTTHDNDTIEQADKSFLFTLNDNDAVVVNEITGRKK